MDYIIEKHKSELFNIEFESFDDKLIPEYQTEFASGADIKSKDEIEIPSGSIVKVLTGVKIKHITEGFALQIRPRGSVSLDNVEVIYGTIDNDFRGEISVIIKNSNKRTIIIKKYTRIAQIIPEKIYEMNINKINKIRGDECGSTNSNNTGIFKKEQINEKKLIKLYQYIRKKII